jgi:hypothetical protein
MNIPARYCTGYLGDIGVPVDINPMDFSGWFEVCLDWRWYTMTGVTIIPASAGLLWGAGVTPQTSRSRPPSASPISRASKWRPRSRLRGVKRILGDVAPPARARRPSRFRAFLTRGAKAPERPMRRLDRPHDWRRRERHRRPKIVTLRQANDPRRWRPPKRSASPWDRQPAACCSERSAGAGYSGSMCLFPMA